ncbi:hypothetical protein GGI20_005590 [Coemansia sp. BCRC 34301]|nr:hypothetical protein GGI20_005590 [Coemansia sp. BCRC 34301]
MPVTPERQSRTLDTNVHARLLVKHIIMAGSCVGQEDAGKSLPQQHMLMLEDSSSSTLTFSLVRVLGTVVHKQSLVVDGIAREFLFLDDGTGVIAVTLSQRTCADDEIQQAVHDEMGLRLSLYCCAQPASTGLTVEVFGRIAHCSGQTCTAPPMPTRWIECDQISIRADPMAYSSAIVEVLAVYRNYFPARHTCQQEDHVSGVHNSGPRGHSSQHTDVATVLDQPLDSTESCLRAANAPGPLLPLVHNDLEVVKLDGQCNTSDADDMQLLDALHDMEDIPFE